jgi:hypothetical protein
VCDTRAGGPAETRADDAPIGFVVQMF